MKYIITINGNKYEVEVEEGQAQATYVGKAEAPVAPAPVQAAPVQAAPAPVQAAPVQAAPAGAGDPIKAPLPGTIVKVNAKANTQVKAGDILFVLEAMKMENEIVAPKDGTITSVTVNTGASVVTDAILATIQ